MAESIPNYAKGYKHFKRALKYAQSVVNKTIDVSLSIRLECSRFITELELEKDKTYPYYYDKVAGEKICCFMETLQHVKGKWTRSEDRFLKLEPWQEFICCNVFGWKKRKDNLRRYLVAYIEVPRKNGKALALNTPIPTPNGFVEMGNLKINDIVYGSNGEQCHITNITDIMYNHKCYEVEFNNGEKIVADANHLWITDSRQDRDRKKGKHNKNYGEKPSIKTTEEIANSVICRDEYNHRIKVCQPIQNSHKDLVIDPYVLGVWLGDGYSLSSAISCDSKDLETIEHIREKGYYIHKAKNKYEWRISKGYKDPNKKTDSFTVKLKSLNLLGNKHIPNDYMNASIEQRFELLQGLMDTDGYTNHKGQCEFSQKNYVLAYQVYQLVNSLGFRATIKEKHAKCDGKDCGIAYRVMFQAYNDRQVFKLTRKQERLPNRPLKRSHQNFRTIVSVKEVPSVPVRCIEVDSADHCYLVGPSYIRTHNSFFSAGFGLYMFCVDREAGAEVYCGATNLEQALHVFKPARLICEKNKQLLKKYSIDVKKESMELPDGSIFKPIVGDAHDGASPHCSILDEVHEHPNDALYQSQITGMGGRDQPLVLMITTAGKNIESFCKEQHDYVLKNQQQDILVQDLTTFGVIYSIDDKDDPYTVESIKKANPNFGISVREDYVLRQLDIAKRSIKDRSDYLTKHLNIWVNSKSAYFDSLLWSELAERDLNINDFLKDPCYIAVDLSAKYDLTAIVIMFIRVKNGLKHYYVFTNAYLPSDTIEDSTNINYKIYQKYCQIDNKNSLSGKVLTEIPGAEIDGEFVYNELNVLLKKLGNIQMVLYDSWHTTFIMQQLAKAHPSFASRLVELNQNTKNLNAGMKELTSAMLSHRIHHDGSEVLAWNISNVISKTDKKGNDFPDKENKNAKIDTAVCLIMCASQANNFVQKVSLSQRILNGGAIGTINV